MAVVGQFESRRRRLFSRISHSSLPDRPTKPSVNWYQLRLDVKVLCAAAGTVMARLAAGVGAMGLTCRTPQCVYSYISVRLPPCKAALFSSVKTAV